MANSSESFDEHAAGPERSEDAPEDLLDAYDENDEAVTRFVEAAREEPRWLVQITPFDRRSMSRERLLHELRRGVFDGGTLVWRDGMRNWSTIRRVGELGAPETLPPARRAARSLPAPAARAFAPRERSANEAGVLLAASGTSALVIGVTLALLAWAGVFEAGARAPDPNTASASSAAR